MSSSSSTSATSALVGGRGTSSASTVREALPEVEGQGFFELLDRVYATGEPFVGTGMRRCVAEASGSRRLYLDFVYQPMRDLDGKVTAILAHGVDVTEQQARRGAATASCSISRTRCAR